MKKKQSESEFKKAVNEKFPLMKGYQREFCKCDQCGTMAYYDYVPFSLSRPVITTNCGHDFHRHYQSFKK